MKTGAVHQVVHGYDHGHRLLSTSVELTAEERYRLDKLSDLSGYPDRHDPPPYVSGYPCGRFYVTARTWIDPLAERRGTVGTHSLLLPLEVAAELADITALFPLFRLPMRPLESSRYSQPLDSVDIQGPAAWLLRRRANVLALSIEHESRPVAFVDLYDPEEALRAVWWCSVPALRRAFAFCTHA